MTTMETRVQLVAAATSWAIEWGPVIAGVIAAAALGVVLDSFAMAIGLSVSSTAPTWRDALFTLVLLSGLYLLVAVILAYGFGAYVAARPRSRAATGAVPSVEFSYGMHGLLVWELATLLTGLVAVAAAQALPRLAAPFGSPAGASCSVTDENIIAYDLDRLFRGERRAGDINYTRSEAARILLTTSGHSGMQPDDRTSLVRLVAATTGLPPPEAERRVNEVASSAKQNIEPARRSAVLLGFMTGAAVAWFAATAGETTARAAAPSRPGSPGNGCRPQAATLRAGAAGDAPAASITPCRRYFFSPRPIKARTAWDRDKLCFVAQRSTFLAISGVRRTGRVSP